MNVWLLVLRPLPGMSVQAPNEAVPDFCRYWYRVSAVVLFDKGGSHSNVTRPLPGLAVRLHGAVGTVSSSSTATVTEDRLPSVSCPGSARRRETCPPFQRHRLVGSEGHVVNLT